MKKVLKMIVLMGLLLFGLLMLLIVINNKREPIKTMDLSEEIHGTILKKQDIETDGKHFYLIYTEEHNNAWCINTFYENSPKLWKQLEMGDVISFCIEKDNFEFVDHAMFLDVLTLKKEDKILYTLDDYNRYLKRENNQLQLTGTVAAGISLGIFLYILISPRKKQRNRIN